ncbi:hypothetical protein [Succinivibrio dextrinosolvens]|jgi:hypothetical protein|uniref:hypothetical protein n=1 Tax=Succinivibrio dextrinosolvens TaxID=83771 RepID=UPI00241D679D|nr:hypothetical protein [Succinivibrio dextrinosolvens]MBE6423099.1 hypothetical protein [Succinivibrio dextrinosolvens]
MKKSIRKLISSCLLFVFSLQQLAYSAEVLVDSGQRQTVLERTKQYAGNIDAVDVRTNATLSFQKNLKVHSGGSTAGFGDKCGGYTTSACGTPCCGEKECKSVCSANMSVAHGNTCLSDYTTSWCGMSCCGKEDCDRVCYNYRTSTVSVENCGGYIKTATGESCCGLEDCRNRNCGGYTSTVSADFGTEQKCCGKKNCEDVKCDYNHSTEVISGGTAKCCGTKDCYSKYCEDQTSVDSKVDPSKRNLECCGKANCHQVECDGYTQTNTPTGIQQCCGYEDCRNKECEYRRTATNEKGEKVACCGNLECTKIEMERTYTAPHNTCIKETYDDCYDYEYNCYYSTTGKHCQKGRSCTTKTRYKCCNGLQTVTTEIIPAETPQKNNCSSRGTLYFYTNGSAPRQYVIRECSKGGTFTNNQCIAYHKCVQYKTSCETHTGASTSGGCRVIGGGSYPVSECCKTYCANYTSCTPGSPGCEKTSGWYYTNNPNG